MIRNKDEEKEIDLPSEDDENVGDGAPTKKREKRRKSKEERIAERKVVFWTLVIVVAITIGFWLVPRVRSIFDGEPVSIGGEKPIETKIKDKEDNNYVEITL